ncbi:protein phosphatase 2C domain-containing protein [Actinoplanes sp. NPDC049548]|uniref:protein phosphatase 2C domain-containing protein n=1 Tax=Actinoplanes sp. NPDC049548 TaxID=3155152 RepID=UPI00343B77F5
MFASFLRHALDWFIDGDEKAGPAATPEPRRQQRDLHPPHVPANGSVYQGGGRPPDSEAPPQREQIFVAPAGPRVTPGPPMPSAPPPQRHAAQPESPPAARAPQPQETRPRRPWDPPVVGKPTAAFAPKPSMASAYRPDYIADGWATRDFVVRAASVRGYSHRVSGDPRQDDIAVAWHEASGAVLFAVADGVGNAPLSHVGATSACRAAISAMTTGLDSPTGRVDWAGLLQGAAWQICEQARISLGLREINKQAAEEQMATTLVAGMVLPHPDGPRVELVQAGDSSAWILNVRARRYQCLTPTKFRQGEEVFSNSVVALPRVPPTDVKHGLLNQGEILLVGTDGFGDPLGDGNNMIGDHFADAFHELPPVLKFANDLDFSRETWDDDRTLFALWPHRSRG